MLYALYAKHEFSLLSAVLSLPVLASLSRYNYLCGYAYEIQLLFCNSRKHHTSYISKWLIINKNFRTEIKLTFFYVSI